MTPSVVVITSGAPGAGKSTLAARLGAELGLPVIDRDDLKDALFDALGWSDAEWSARMGGASWRLLFTVAGRLAAAGCSFVLDSNFERGRHPELASLAAQATLVEVHCATAPQEMARRFRRRWERGERHPGHTGVYADEAVYLAEFGRRDFAPLEESDIVIRVDTATPDSVDLQGIVTAIRGAMDGSEDR